MKRAWALVEREMRRFRRSPILIVVSMVFPIVQLIVLGYAFGGNVKHLETLPAGVRLGSNANVLRGGYLLWLPRERRAR